MDFIKVIVEFYKNNQALTISLVSAFAGAILVKLIPEIYSWIIKGITFLGKKLGGKFSYKSIQDAYLNWMVLDNQDLRFAGIVSSSHQKSRLEQVFIAPKMTTAGTDFNQTAIKYKLFNETSSPIMENVRNYQ